MEENLWVKVGNVCLEKAHAMLEKETAPTEATVGAVCALIQAAARIDELNLLRKRQSRFCAEALPARPFGLPKEEN